MLSQQQIIALAVEVGAVEMVTTAGKEVVCFDAIAMQRFYQEAYQRGVRDERDACAKLTESEACGGAAFNSAANYMARRIRARSAE